MSHTDQVSGTRNLIARLASRKGFLLYMPKVILEVISVRGVGFYLFIYVVAADVLAGDIHTVYS